MNPTVLFQPWVSEGIKSNAMQNDILADTGAMALAVTTALTIIVAADRGNTLVLALRDSLNAADVSTQRLYALEGNTVITIGAITFAAGQRLVVRAAADIDDEIQVSIIN